MENTQKNPKFFCNACDFITNNKKDYNRHVSSAKHINRTILNKKTPENPNKYICKHCQKTYSVRNSLWYHEKKCSNIEPIITSCNNNNNNQNISQITPELIMEILKQNTELTNKIVDICKNGTNNNNTINSHNTNNSFNLNFFLNETCKGALNISEFIETIKLQLKDLESVGKLGYIEGISEIIIRGLKELDITKRPIHCSDIKRETLYVKNENVWENDKEKEKMKYTIQHIAAKNFKQIPEWIKENPLAKDSESKKHLEYMRILNKLTGGINDEEDEKNYNKIIKKVANEVVIEKEN